MARNKTILVTGGAGYIGSHTVKVLQDTGYKVVVLDNLSCGNAEIVERDLKAKLIIGDVGDRVLLARIFAIFPISAVIHLAANNLTDSSIANPIQHYWQNVSGTLNLLKAMMAASVKKIIFASAAEVYGIPQKIPFDESHCLLPGDLYSSSKSISERILADFSEIYGLNSIVFRYFNVAGIDPDRKLRKTQLRERHLICSVLMASLYRRNSVAMFYTNHLTPDGTYIRDYIHVSDVAQAHVLGLERILKTETNEVFNLGSDRGFSVRQIIETANRITGKNIKIQHCDRQERELPILINGNTKAKNILGWQPQYEDLMTLVSHTWNYYLQSCNSQQPVELVTKKLEPEILTA